MLNLKKKRNISYLDPVKVNNYNKFLLHMDKNSYNFIPILEVPTTNRNKNNNNTEVNKSIENCNEKCKRNKSSTNLVENEKDIKTTLDLLIEKICNRFNKHNFNSSFFNGSNSLDIDLINDETNYPNIYSEGKTYEYYKNKKNKTNILDNIESEKEFININVEINNINDILKIIETYKFTPEVQYNINMEALHNIKKPLEKLNNMIGMKDLKNSIVDQILYFVQGLHLNKGKINSGDFMHTVIYGPPGTGKTEIAKIMGKIYSKIGILKKGTFKKVTRSDLIAGYLGQTAIKTSDVIKESLGGVLFIDEAYSLGNPDKKDSFSKECIDTLCEALSDKKDELMVIIAGYEDELNDCFFKYNQGLESRFTWRFKTDNYDATDLYHIFLKKVNEIGWNYAGEEEMTINWFKKNIEYFKCFGRDVETILAKTKIIHSRRVFCKTEDEKRRLLLIDLEKGFQLYISSNNIKNRKEDEYMKKYISNTMYC